MRDCDGFIFYPKKYIIDDSVSHKSYSEGVDALGRPCTVYLEPEKNGNTAKHLYSPSFSVFADRRVNAQNPCFASEDNSPSSPDGILLIERPICTDEKMLVFIGRWANVLKPYRDHIRPALGIGFLDISMSKKIEPHLSRVVEEYKQLTKSYELASIDSRPHIEKKILKSVEIIRSGRRKWFSANIVKYEEAITLDILNRHAVSELLGLFLKKYLLRGVYSGVLFRVRNDMNIIETKQSFCVNVQYDYTLSKPKTVEDTVGEFNRYRANKLFKFLQHNPSYVLDMIPLIRINFGTTGNECLNRDVAGTPEGIIPKVYSTFVEKCFLKSPLACLNSNKAFLASNIAVRTALVHQGDGKGNILASSIHAYSSQYGNPFELGLLNGETKRLFIMDYKVSQSVINNRYSELT